jgi:integrase
MAKVNFTAGRVADLQCESGKGQSFLWDTSAPGLGLRVTSNGAKAYMFQAKLNGQAIRITIGSPAIWNIDKARAEARRLKMLIDGGQDPRQVKTDELEAEQAARDTKKAAETAAATLAAKHSTTFKQVWDIYLEERKPQWGERHYQDHIKKIAPGGIPSRRGTRGLGVTIAGPLYYFASMPISSIDSETVEEWAKIEGKTRPTSARLAWRMLKVFFQWCYESKAYRDLIQPQNPGKTKKSGESLGKAKSKRDNLELAQLPGWFDAVQKLSNPTVSAYLQALLLSGARPGEVLEMKWVDINWRWESIVIRDKIDGERTIPLTPFVAHLFATLPRRNEYVFSSAQKNVAIIGKPHLSHKQACDAAGLQGLTLHGLRRSFASLAEQTEAPGGVAAQIQGHKPQSAREKSYIVRPMDFLRKWHVIIEGWILEQAEIEFIPAPAGLRAIK